MDVLVVFADFLLAPLRALTPGSSITWLVLAGLVPLAVFQMVRSVFHWCMSL